MPYAIDPASCRTCNAAGVVFRFRYNKVNDKHYRQPDCKACERTTLLKWRDENKVNQRTYLREWYRKTHGRVRRSCLEMTDEIRAGWHRDKAKARLVWKKQASAQWDTDLTNLVLKEARDLCKRRGQIFRTQYQIDHVIPFKGKTVCGLHVWNNLQVIPKKLNLQKGTKEMEKSLT